MELLDPNTVTPWVAIPAAADTVLFGSATLCCDRLSGGEQDIASNI
jgi:hypothetical protein